MEDLKGKYRYEAQDRSVPVARVATGLPKKRQRVKLTGKEAKIDWTPEMIENFPILKDKLVKLVDGDGLWLPNPHGKWTILCDASDYAVRKVYSVFSTVFLLLLLLVVAVGCPAAGFG